MLYIIAMSKASSSNAKLSGGTTRGKVESIILVIDGSKWVYDRKFLRYLMEDIESGDSSSTESIEFAKAIKTLLQ
jgi:hypothetical protein